MVNLDFRGAGLSAGKLHSLSWDAFDADIGSVLDSLAIERAGICAMGPAALAAFHFAAARPQRVARVVTISAGDSEANRSVLSLRRINPRVEAMMRGVLFCGVDNKENASAIAAVARSALDVDALSHWEQLLAESSAEAMAANVGARTLCVHPRDDELVGVKVGEALVRGMRDATLLQVDAKTGMQVWSDPVALEAMVTFLAEGFGVRRRLKARASKRSGRGVQYPSGISARELDVLRLVAAGKRNHEIAKTLCISLNTVSHHMRNIFAKTETANRTEAAAFAHRKGLC